MEASLHHKFSIEGGAYPEGGSDEIAVILANIVTQNGGKVINRARVNKILIENGTVSGVELENGFTIETKTVVSSIGYHHTFQKLLDSNVCEKVGIPTTLPCDQSLGFLMVNISFEGNAESLGLTNTNYWYFPLNEENEWDLFAHCERWEKDPKCIK